jgi:hypothetical protein
MEWTISMKILVLPLACFFFLPLSRKRVWVPYIGSVNLSNLSFVLPILRHRHCVLIWHGNDYIIYVSRHLIPGVKAAETWNMMPHFLVHRRRITIHVCLHDEIRQSIVVERFSVLATHLYKQFNHGVEDLRPFIVVRFASLYCRKHFAPAVLFNFERIMVTIACRNIRELRFLLTYCVCEFNMI